MKNVSDVHFLLVQICIPAISKLLNHMEREIQKQENTEELTVRGAEMNMRAPPEPVHPYFGSFFCLF